MDQVFADWPTTRFAAGAISTGGVEVQALPGWEHAVIPEEKLRGYALNPEHEEGRHKARVFKKTLGIEQDDWWFLRDQVVEGLSQSEAALHHETIREEVRWQNWTVPVLVTGRNSRRGFVTTGWTIRESDPAPRLATAFVENSARNRKLLIVGSSDVPLAANHRV